MKALNLVGMAILAFAIICVSYSDRNRIQNLQAENQAWRQAAQPVFQSRGTYDITDHATPDDLKCYLNEHCAVVWQEHSAVERGLSPAIFSSRTS